MPIRKKLLLAFGVIGFLTGIIGFLAVEINAGIGHDITQISHASIEQASAANGMFDALHDLEVILLRMMNEGERGAAFRPSPEVAAAISRFETNLTSFQNATQTAVVIAEAEGDSEEISEAKEDATLFENIQEEFERLKNAVLDEQKTGITTPLTSGTAKESYKNVVDVVDGYRASMARNLKEEVEAVENSIRRANAILVGSTFAILLSGGVMAWVISLSISRPLGVLTEAAKQISRGHLDTKVSIRSRDEIGALAETFNQMTSDLGATTVSRDYLDSILKSMANSLIVIDLDYRIQSANDATSRLLGYSRSELIGRFMMDLLDPKKDASSLFEQAKAGSPQTDIETGYRAKSGDFVPVTFSAAAVHDAEEAITGIVCVAQDISARKQAEAELEEISKRLVETSRQAGMAEVAASVLHNVGNVLNSVNVSASLIASLIRESKVSTLGDAVALIQAHGEDLPRFFSDDPRGKLLPGYLADLATHLAEEEAELLHEIHSLLSNVTHIKEIVSMQQSYARVSAIPERCNIIELLENAVRLNGEALGNHIEVHREYSEVPDVLTERHKVLQILVNLIRNAEHACKESDKQDKQVVLRVLQQNGLLQIYVIDNGMGIPPENLARIFHHGFTTKRDGHGFGLHSGALTARELGGKLSAFSEGPGKGSTFILELPLQPESPQV